MMAIDIQQREIAMWYIVALVADGGDFFQGKEMPSLRSVPWLTALNPREKAIVTLSIQKQRAEGGLEACRSWSHLPRLDLGYT